VDSVDHRGALSDRALWPLRLPPILPHDLTLYGWLRDLHTDLACLFFATFLAHFGAALFHGLIRREGASRAWRRGGKPINSGWSADVGAHSGLKSDTA
jgi:hypothetical protein